ncbi:LAFE_0E11012g1_1 [Lachancea fermentati]|uniref:LAFE_0E11012g1_1 n=1 Tax=Lachancea fermentati TaxID=4955 RepID=A0A1G4MDQ2_LACFM|nr:LAFE_0E11012g1_1 [Lachancea fermentati]
MSYSQLETRSFGNDDWCLGFQPILSKGILTSLSNGFVHLLDWQTAKSIMNISAHNKPIKDMKLINGDSNGGSIFATASETCVKIFDIRSNQCIASLHNDKSAPFLSLDSHHDMLACGTELSGIDAEIHIYDIKRWDTPLRSLVDSHHDDVTTIKFHPSDRNVLMSGSTDGYVNIYDLTQQEEDDALHQVINFASIHSCGWLAPNRIFTLSHMETFGVHELNDKSDEPKEPQPADFGDVRQKWGCDYVVDVYPGFIATGRTEEGKGELKLLPFSNEMVDKESLIIPRAHGDEVVRDVFIPYQQSNLLYSCGEDGCVRIWKSNCGALKVPQELWDYSKPMNVFENSVVEVEMGDVSSHNTDAIASNDRPGDHTIEESKAKIERKGKKDKGKRKDKKHRYKPY